MNAVSKVMYLNFEVKPTSILISINPKWCELIFSGKKRLEIRKRVPKNVTYPLICYVYQTVDKNWKYNILPYLANCQGKVIGKFICNNIDEWESEFYLDDNEVFECIKKVEEDEFEPGEYVYTCEFTNEWFDDELEPEFAITILGKNSCVTYNGLRKYIGSGFNTFYSICVDSVERFTLPMEIQYFSNKDGKMINRAPQSWCYCELR